MKLDLILENIRNKYSLGLLEESENLTEKEMLQGKIIINESTMKIRSMLVEEGTINGVHQVLQEAWSIALIEESEKGKAYDAYFKKQLSKCGYDSVDDIPKDKKDEFFNKVDADWNSKDEAGKDGEK